MWKLALHGKRRFANDPRYNLRSVTDGFASRCEDAPEDTPLLRRIVSAYKAAAEREQAAPECYRPTAWWNEVRRTSLGPVREALRRGDTSTLGEMYRHFYRDPCSTGLVSVPWGMRQAYFGPATRDLYRHVYLSNALYRLDYWREQVGGAYQLSDLAGPSVGHPFGVLIDNVLIRTGADYQHHCARTVRDLLPGSTSVVVEIGGGFGGAAYYLLRDLPGVTYINFDVSESLALAAYNLMKSLPDLRFQLCGEAELTQGAIHRADVILLPLQELEQLPDAIAQAAFSSHAISDLSPAALSATLAQIARITRGHLFYAGSGQCYAALEQSVAQFGDSFFLTDVRDSRWNRFYRKQQEIECIYRLTGGDGAVCAAPGNCNLIDDQATGNSLDSVAAHCLQEAWSPAEGSMR